MTRDEILNMPAGREMDTLVAEKVLGLKSEIEECPYCYSSMWVGKERSWCGQCHEWRYSPYKNYSDEIEPAMEVVTVLENDPREILPEFVRKGADIKSLRWCVELRECKGSFQNHYAEAETLSLAICRAALLAVMEL